MHVLKSKVKEYTPLEKCPFLSILKSKSEKVYPP